MLAMVLDSLTPIAHAASVASEPTVQSLVGKIQNEIITPVISLLFVLATMFFLWGVLLYVVGSKGEPTKLAKGKQVMVWGIIGMAIMAGAWGIVKIICVTLGTSCNVPRMETNTTIQEGNIPIPAVPSTSSGASGQKPSYLQPVQPWSAPAFGSGQKIQVFGK